MPGFQYTAKRGPQEVVEGRIDAESRSQVLTHLTNLGYTPLRISEAAQTAKPVGIPNTLSRDGKVPARHLNVFTRQFASLVRAQTPLLRALGILEEQTAHGRLRRIIADIAEDIRQGQTLSGTLAKYPRVFSPLYVNLARAGEIGGMLDVVLDRLAAQADRDEALRGKGQAALAYPLFVGVVGLATVVFLLSFVMPRLLGLFAGFGDRLPLPTRLLLATSTLMSQWWFWAVVAMCASGLMGVWNARGSRIRLLLDRVILRTPLLGALVRQLELARFSHSFGLLLVHGIPILQALEVALPVVRHPIIRQDLARLPGFLKQGGSLASSLKPLKVVSPFLVNTVAVGEEGGKAGEALIEVANFYEREVERLLQTAAALLEPAMVLMVGACVGLIVMAVLLPVFELGTMIR